MIIVTDDTMQIYTMFKLIRIVLCSLGQNIYNWIKKNFLLLSSYSIICIYNNILHNIKYMQTSLYAMFI